VGQVLEVRQQPHRQRLIELELAPKLLQHLRIGGVAGHHPGRVALDRLGQEEDQHDHPDQRRDHGRQSVKDVGGLVHRRVVSRQE